MHKEVETGEQVRELRMPRYVGVCCDECGAKFTHALGEAGLDERGRWKSLLPKDAYEITLVGGYDNFFDTSGGDPQLLYCTGCVNRLGALFPTLKPEVALASEVRT